MTVFIMGTRAYLKKLPHACFLRVCFCVQWCINVMEIHNSFSIIFCLSFRSGNILNDNLCNIECMLKWKLHLSVNLKELNTRKLQALYVLVYTMYMYMRYTQSSKWFNLLSLFTYRVTLYITGNWHVLIFPTLVASGFWMRGIAIFNQIWDI